MAGSAQLWPGPRMRAYFKSLLAAEPGVDAELADRLAARLVRHVARMLVWDITPATAEPPPADAATANRPQTPPQEQPASDADAATAPHTGAPRATPAEAFDPFAFSIVVVLKRQGRAALMKRLEAIADAAHLHQMASAQHIGVDKSITAAKRLREAIVAGAEQRLADRRAAAS